MGVFYVPLITQRETCVECSQCGSLKLTSLPLASLGDYSADQLGQHLHARTSIIVQFLAVASLLLSCAPVVGLVLGLIALLASLKAGGWPLWLSIAGTTISSLVLLAFGILLFLG
jgi:hypothetical protein